MSLIQDFLVINQNWFVDFCTYKDLNTYYVLDVLVHKILSWCLESEDVPHIEAI